MQVSPEIRAYVDKAIANLTAMELLNPGDVAPAYNKALMHLSVGDWKEGWPLFRYRLAVPNCRYAYRHFPVKPYDGGSVDGKHLLVWTDQGIGDQILCASMLPDLADMCASVTVIAARRLGPLLKRSIPKLNVHFHMTGYEIPERLKTFNFDYQLSMGDVGQVTRSSDDQFTGKPFLKADPALVDHFRTKYARSPFPKVGLSWQSQSKVAMSEKSFPVELLDAITINPQLTFLNMQYDACAEDIAHLGKNAQTDDEVDQLLSMDMFAAQLSAMDKVVSASSSMVHLASALGVDTHVIVPRGKGCHWYWRAEGDKCIWYDSLTIHRADSEGWEKPIKDVAKLLMDFAQTRRLFGGLSLASGGARI